MKRININDYSNEELQVKKTEKMKSGKKVRKMKRDRLQVEEDVAYSKKKSVLTTSSTIIWGMIWF